MNVRAWADSRLGPVFVSLAREATGTDRPLERIRPARPRPLAAGRIVGFWSLVAGVGCSTTAALVAHRSAAGGHAPLLADLDRWAPSLALRARLEGATLADALLRPDLAPDLASRWAEVPFLPGSPLRGELESGRAIEILRRVARGRAIVLDLGAGADGLDEVLLSALDHLVVCVGTRTAQLQAAFVSATIVRPDATSVAVVGAERSDAERIAARLPWPLAAAIPADDFLARDDFAVRAPLTRALDSLIAAVA